MNAFGKVQPLAPKPLHSVLACQKCGREDDTVRRVAYPYVLSLLVVTFRDRFEGQWCGKHQAIQHALATLITATIGWIGFPFGLIYTPLTLLRLARGGDMPDAPNAQLLKAIASHKQDQGDVPGARRALEAAVQFCDDEPLRESLRRVYASGMHASGPATREHAPQVLVQFGLVTLLVAVAVALGMVTGLATYLTTWGIFDLMPDELTYLQIIIGWLPLAALGFAALFLLRGLLTWVMERCRFTQMALANAVALLAGALLFNGLVTGRVAGELFETLQYDSSSLSILALLQVLGAVLTRGVGFELVSKFSYGMVFWNIYLAMLAGLALYTLATVLGPAWSVTRWQRRLALMEGQVWAEGLSRQHAGGWAAFSAALAALTVFWLLFPQQTTVDYLNAWSVYTEGSNYSSEGQFEMAANRYREALQLNPQMIDASYELAWVYLMNGQDDQAVREAQRTIEMASDWSPAYENLGSIFYQMGQYEHAEENYEQALALNPDDYYSNFYMGLIRWEQGDLQAAEDYMRRAQEIYPQSVDAATGLGRIYLDQEDYDQSTAAFKAALAVDGTASEAYFGLGLVYLSQNDYENGVAQFEKAVFYDPENQDAHYMLLSSLAYSGQHEALVEAARQCVEQIPDWAAAHSFLALGQYQLGDEKAARASLETARAAPDKNDIDWFLLGRTSEKLGQYEQAEQEFRAGLEYPPRPEVTYTPADFYLTLADLFDRQDRFDEALEWCDKAEAAEALPADVVVARSYIHFHMGDIAGAETLANHALSEDPENLMAHSVLSEVYLARGDAASALAEAETVLHGDSYSDYGLNDKTLALLKMNRAEEAVDTAQALVALSPMYDMGHYGLGMAYIQMGQKTEAVTELERFIALYTDRAYARPYKAAAEAMLKNLK